MASQISNRPHGNSATPRRRIAGLLAICLATATVNALAPSAIAREISIQDDPDTLLAALDQMGGTAVPGTLDAAGEKDPATLDRGWAPYDTAALTLSVLTGAAVRPQQSLHFVLPHQDQKSSAGSRLLGFLETVVLGEPDRAIEAPDAASGAGHYSLRPRSVAGIVVATLIVLLAGYFGGRLGLKSYRAIARWFDARALGVRRIVHVEDVDPNDLLNPAEVHRRGWSMEQMVEVLGPPDYAVIDPTGHSPPLIFISRKRVETLEKTSAFHTYHQRRGDRADAATAQIDKWIRLRDGYVTYAEGLERNA